ncbi:hypothetical protein OHAE_2171 [Ochrobactrum soli]|uniref:Uncharacterized protein n=1 Tax=Ochrobactrum soli TaxID=2448455 RepID=A0A2P9HQ96_9HYPH|nr:hypothetical protein OHAE_2171 [[Ochrobactrum] soli]
MALFSASGAHVPYVRCAPVLKAHHFRVVITEICAAPTVLSAHVSLLFTFLLSSESV